MENKLLLTQGVEAIIEHTSDFGSKNEAYRIILAINSTSPIETKGLLKNYLIITSIEYLEDNKYEPTLEGAKKFSLDIVKRRFQESGNIVPHENGLEATSKYGIKLINS